MRIVTQKDDFFNKLSQFREYISLIRDTSAQFQKLAL